MGTTTGGTIKVEIKRKKTFVAKLLPKILLASATPSQFEGVG